MKYAWNTLQAILYPISEDYPSSYWDTKKRKEKTKQTKTTFINKIMSS